MNRSLLILALLLGCPRESAEPSAPAEPPPPAVPERASGHFCINTHALAEIRQGIPGPIAAALPEDAADFLVSQLGAPPGMDSLAPGSGVCGLSIGEEVIFAARVRRGASSDALGAVSRIGDVVVFGDEQARDEGAEYLARVVFDETLGSAVSFHVGEGVVAGRRPWVERSLVEIRANGRSAIAAERERHDESPAFGDPEVALDVLVRHVRRLSEYLPDLGEVQGEVVAADGIVAVEIRASIRGDSPLARALAAQSQAPTGFGALPRGTALAYMRASEGTARVSNDLLEVAGDRAADAERVQIAQAAEAMIPPFTLALGAQSEPFAEYSGVLPDEESIGRVLAGPYVRELLGGLFGCGRASGVWPASGDRPGARCQRPPLSIQSTSLTLGRRDARVVSESPDVSRLVGEGYPVLGAVYLDPLRVPSALALFAFADPPDAAVEATAPVLLTWAEREGMLVIRFRCPPAAISQLVAIASTFSD